VEQIKAAILEPIVAWVPETEASAVSRRGDEMVAEYRLGEQVRILETTPWSGAAAASPSFCAPSTRNLTAGAGAAGVRTEPSRVDRSIVSGARTWGLVTQQPATVSRAYVLVIGPRSCHAVELPAVGELMIGRGDDADVALDDGSVSRRHARLLVAGREIRIADLGSHNGTLVNGIPVEGSRSLASSDEISVGENTLVLHLQRQAARAAGASIGPELAVTRVSLGSREVIIADPAMARIYELIARLGRADVSVLVCGETGVGKENAALAVHHHSRRCAGPFVAINCAAIQETLAEAELFGYEKGAFSGASATKPGLLEAAGGGTVFLDEIGELSLAVQAKLLRAVESGRVTRVGGLREREVDLRIVAATNRDLEAEVRAGRFRQDLLFRLNVGTVALPPLRDRPREIGVLARVFLDAACTRAARRPLEIAPSAMRRLAAHAWPGNVRELRNVMEFAAATVEGEAVEENDLRLSASSPAPEEAGRRDDRAEPAVPVVFQPINEEVRQLEARRMVEALAVCGGVHTRAAALIGMPIRTFSSKLKLYRLSSATPGKSP
jgi:DNA-binding NtrC family response regulator